MRLEDILLEYGKKHGIDHLQLDEEGISRLKINDTLILALEKSLKKEGFYLYSTIGFMPKGKEEKIALRVLEANLFGKETGRANIGYEPNSRLLVLFEYFDEQTTDYHFFETQFTLFLQNLVYWIAKFGEISAQKTEPMDKRTEDLLNQAKKRIFLA